MQIISLLSEGSLQNSSVGPCFREGSHDSFASAVACIQTRVDGIRWQGYDGRFSHGGSRVRGVIRAPAGRTMGGTRRFQSGGSDEPRVPAGSTSVSRRIRDYIHTRIPSMIDHY